MSFRGLAICVVWFGLLSACSLFVGPKQLPELPLLDPGDYFIGKNNSSGSAKQFLEQITIENSETSQVMLAAWVVDLEKLSLVGLTPTGQRLLTLSYDGETFSEDYSPLLEEPIPGRMVFAHLQLAHWPQQSVEKVLSESVWQFRVEEGRRNFLLRDRLIMSIIRDPADSSLIKIDSQAVGMEITIQQLNNESKQ